MDDEEYVDRKGNKITQKEHATLFENYSYKLIKKDILKNGFKISTVWLGDTNPLLIGIFESLVTHPEWDDEEYVGYNTEEEAFKGHKKLVEKYSSESY